MVKFRFNKLLYSLCLLLLAIDCNAITLPSPGEVVINSTVPVQAPGLVANGSTLTLKEAIWLALRDNPDIKNAELQRTIDKFSLAIAHNQFLPQYTFTGEATYQTSNKPSYNAKQNASLLLPFGTTVGVGLGQNYSSSSNGRMLNSASFSLTQPLLRGFGFAVTQTDLANAIDTEKTNQLLFKQKIINTIVNVVSSYYNLVGSYNNLRTQELSLQDQQKTLQQTREKINAGKAALADQIQQQANIANTQLSIAAAKNSIRQNYQNLLIILGLDPQAKLNIVKGISTTDIYSPNLATSISIALANNIGYQQTLLNYRILQRDLVKAKDTQKWQLDAKATINQSLQSGSNNLPTTDKNLTLNLDIPIHDLTRQQQLVNAKVLLDQARNSLIQEKNQLITDVTNAYEDMKFNQQQLVSYQQSINLAQKSLEVAKIKFNYGKVSSFELTSLQTSLITTQLGYITQQITYLNSVENFYQTLGTTLDRWHIILSY